MTPTFARAATLLALALVASFPAHADTPLLGEIKWVSFNFAPKGWAQCNGQLLPINQNQALFSLLGTTYGGDGRVTFALPDFRGRVMLHWGQGPGLAPYSQGQKAGSETVTLTENELPVHSHTAYGSNSKANRAAPKDAYPAYITTDTGASYELNDVRAYRPDLGTKPMGAGMLGSAGGSQPVPNQPPFIALNCIIALQGIFPSRN